MSNQKRQYAKGFTLLEVLIAIGITAMIGLGSWQILNSAIRTNDSTQERLAELKQLQKSMLILARDFKQLTSRSVRDEFGDHTYAFTSKADFFVVEFTRQGWRNPLNDKRSDLQRVAYELDENTLVRHYWRVLDRAQDSPPVKRTLLKGVERVEFKFMNESGGWVSAWPSDSQDDSSEEEDALAKYNKLPKAVKIELTTDRFGKVSRLFEVVSYLSGQAIKKADDETNKTNDETNKANDEASKANDDDQ